MVQLIRRSELIINAQTAPLSQLLSLNKTKEQISYSKKLSQYYNITYGFDEVYIQYVMGICLLQFCELN